MNCFDPFRGVHVASCIGNEGVYSGFQDGGGKVEESPVKLGRNGVCLPDGKESS